MHACTATVWFGVGLHLQAPALRGSDHALRWSARCRYLLYGDQTAPIVTINLSNGEPLGGINMVIIVQLMWVVEVMFTFPLQLFPPSIIIERQYTTHPMPLLFL